MKKNISGITVLILCFSLTFIMGCGRSSYDKNVRKEFKNIAEEFIKNWRISLVLYINQKEIRAEETEKLREKLIKEDPKYAEMYKRMKEFLEVIPKPKKGKTFPSLSLQEEELIDQAMKKNKCGWYGYRTRKLEGSLAIDYVGWIEIGFEELTCSGYPERKYKAVLSIFMFHSKYGWEINKEYYDFNYFAWDYKKGELYKSK